MVKNYYYALNAIHSLASVMSANNIVGLQLCIEQSNADLVKNEIERQISSIVCSTFLVNWNSLQNLNFMCGVCKFLKRVIFQFLKKKECGYKRVLLQPQFLISFCINEYKNGNMCGWLTLEFFSLTHNSFLQPFVSRDFSNNYFHSHTSLHYYVMNEMKAHNNKINLLEN